MEGIFWSYIHALKYYSVLTWLKGDRKGNRLPECAVDKVFIERPQVTVDTFKMVEDEAMKALRI